MSQDCSPHGGDEQRKGWTLFYRSVPVVSGQRRPADLNMILLERTSGQGILIGDNVEVILQKSWVGRAKLGIVAPREIKVLRSELERHHDADAIDPLAGTHVSAAKVADLAAWLGSRAATAITPEAREAYEYAREQVFSLIGEVAK